MTLYCGGAGRWDKQSYQMKLVSHCKICRDGQMIQCTAPSDWLHAEATVYHNTTSKLVIYWLHGG